MEGAAEGRAELDRLSIDSSLVARWHRVAWVEDRWASDIEVSSLPNTLRLQVLRGVGWHSDSFGLQRCTSLNVLVLLICEVGQPVSAWHDPSSMRSIHISI